MAGKSEIFTFITGNNLNKYRAALSAAKRFTSFLEDPEAEAILIPLTRHLNLFIIKIDVQIRKF